MEKIKKSLPVDIIEKTYKNWRNDRTLRLGAGIAYYGVFAIVPIFTLMVGVAAFFYSSQDIQVFIGDTLGRILGDDLTNAINQVLNKVISDETQDKVIGASLIGVVSLLVTASFIFVALQDAFDSIWHNSVRLGFWQWIKKYLWSYLVVMLMSLVLFSAILVRSVASYFTSLFPGQFEIFEIAGNLTITIATWSLGIIVLALIYKFLTYEKVAWRIILFGAAITSILIYFGTWLLGFYISNYAGGSVGGALGSVLLLLVWVYYESQIILIGAQFIKTLNENMNKLPKRLKLKG